MPSQASKGPCRGATDYLHRPMADSLSNTWSRRRPWPPTLEYCQHSRKGTAFSSATKVQWGKTDCRQRTPKVPGSEAGNCSASSEGGQRGNTDGRPPAERFLHDLHQSQPQTTETIYKGIVVSLRLLQGYVNSQCLDLTTHQDSH